MVFATLPSKYAGSGPTVASVSTGFRKASVTRIELLEFWPETVL